MKPNFAFRKLLLGSTLLAASSTTAHAETKTWNGVTDSSWGTATNWTHGAPANTDDALFTSSSTSGYNIHLGGAARIINKITFDSTTGANSYTIYLANAATEPIGTTRTLSLSGVGLTVDAGARTIRGAKPGSGTNDELILGNNIAFNIAPNSTLTLDARLRAGATTNNYTKTGAGTVSLNADNGGGSGWLFASASTGFTVSQGVLRFAAGNAFGNSGNKFVVASGAALELTGSVNQTIAASTITLTGTGTDLNGGAAVLSLSVSTGESQVFIRHGVEVTPGSHHEASQPGS